MTIDERIRLQLEAPTVDELYRTNEPPFWGGFHNDRQVYPEETDPSNRLPYGVRSQDFELANETAQAISTMVATAPEGDFKWLATTVVNAATDSNCTVVGAVVIHLGAVNALWLVNMSAIAPLARGLAYALRFRPRRLVEAELQELIQWATVTEPAVADGPNATQCSMELQQLAITAKDVLRFRQRREVLAGENPVVDRDRRQLFERLQAMRFAPTALDLLHHADLEARDGRFSDALHDLRKFLEQVMSLAAGGSDDGAASAGGFKLRKDRVVASGLLSHDEGEVFQKIYNVLSNEGSHSLGSTAELFTVNRTTVIEWSLLISGRMDVKTTQANARYPPGTF